MAAPCRAVNNGRVVSEAWPPADQLWRQWVLLAAGHEALGQPGCRLRSDNAGETVAELYDDRGRWVRMRRIGADRAVVWSSGTQGLDPDTLWDDTPDWAVDDDTAERWAREAVGSVAWFAHGSWACVGAIDDEPTALLEPALSYAGLAGWWGGAVPDVPLDRLDAALAAPNTDALSDVLDPDAARAVARVRRAGGSSATLSKAARVYLREEIYAQMRSSVEIGERGHPKRPVLLRQWAEVNTPLPFRCAVYAEPDGEGTVLIRAADNAGLRKPEVASLHNVLRELRAEETSADSGAWLFARVTCDGRHVTLQRSYDSWPSWFASRLEPGLGALGGEMERRTPSWRPAWASLLPR